MEANRESCKLCLTKIKSDVWAILNEEILDKLDYLQVDLDQSDGETNFLCIECEEKIDKAFNFKSLLVNSVEHGSEDIDQNIPSTSLGKMIAEKIICHLCKNPVNNLSAISLRKLLKDDGMVEVFQGHIQEVNLENIEENSMVCETCQKSLASFWTVVELWLVAENCDEEFMKEDVKDYMTDVKMVEVKKENFDNLVGDSSCTNSSCAIEVNDSNSVASTSGTVKVKNKKRQLTSDNNSDISNKKIITEVDEISDYSVSESIKKEATEDYEEIEIDEIELKNEEIDIKDEDGLLVDSMQNPCLPTKTPCENSNKVNVKKLITHIHKLQIIYICEECSFETKYKHNLKKHEFLHKSLDEVNVYQCKECSFVSKYKHSLKIHLLTHKGLDEVKLYTCKVCSYKTKYKDCLKRHELTHESLINLMVYRCKHCNYETENKYELNTHLLSHESLNVE